MAYWNRYPNRKDWRKPSRKMDASCMNSGSCPYCRGNRLYPQLKLKDAARDYLTDFQEGISIEW